MPDDSTMFVGNKPFMNYVTGVVMQFTVKNSLKVTIKARGKFISRAVDVAEIATGRFLKDQAKVGAVRIGSEDFKNKEGKDIRVSIIEVDLEKVNK